MYVHMYLQKAHTQIIEAIFQTLAYHAVALDHIVRVV